jgi:hypothetical protein
MVRICPRGSYSGVAEDSGVQRCDTMLRAWLFSFRRNVVPTSAKVKQSKKLFILTFRLH